MYVYMMYTYMAVQYMLLWFEPLFDALPSNDDRAPLLPDGHHLVPQTGLRLMIVVPSVAKISKAITLRDTVNLT